jgi:hypothetical protein
MTDDIVTRLHLMAWRGPEGEPWIEQMLRAADEIERLRTALHLAAGLLSSCAPYDHMHPDRVLELLTGERHHDHHESTEVTEADPARRKRLSQPGLSMPGLHSRAR